MINFRIVYIWSIFQSLDRRIWFTILFQENLQRHILSQLELSRTELLKYTPSILMEMWPCHLSCFINAFLYHPACKAWLFEKFIFELEASYSFKITCILVRQVIPLKKSWWFYQNLLFSFMASYLYSFNPSISINENGKYLNHSNI